jgi:hypothetical protein
MTPAPPDFDVERWSNQPYGERLRRMCASWAMQGFGAPGVAYLFYVAKLGLYVGGFLLFASTTRGIGGVGDFGEHPIDIDEQVGPAPTSALDWQ